MFRQLRSFSASTASDRVQSEADSSTETLALQRLLSVGGTEPIRADCHGAVIGPNAKHGLERQLTEVLRSLMFY
jgi:hypothetical protein